MYYKSPYNNFKNTLQEGDKILVKHCILSSDPRVVTYTDGGILVNLHWFHWDYFFEVNIPIEKVLT